MPNRQPTIISEQCPHIGARIAEIGVFDLMPNRLVGVFAHGHHIGDHLRRMIFVGQAVEDRDAGKTLEILDRFLRIAAELDCVVHAAENAGRVLDRSPYGRFASRKDRDT